MQSPEFFDSRGRLRKGLIIRGKLDESGEVMPGPGVRIEGSTVIQDAHTWRSWENIPIQYSAEASTLSTEVRSISRAITPLHEIALFSAPSKRFG